MAKNGSSNEEYEEFEPYCEWKRLDDSDVLEVHLTGFKKEELRVRIKNNSELTVSGERITKDEKKIQFKREIKLPKDINTDQIRAKFGGSILAITLPKKASAAAIAKSKPAAIAKSKPAADAGSGGDGETAATTGKDNAKPKRLVLGLKSSLSRLKLSKETAVAVVVAGVILVLGVYYLIKN